MVIHRQIIPMNKSSSFLSSTTGPFSTMLKQPEGNGIYKQQPEF